MEEIKIGDYIRTEKGFIGKVKEFDKTVDCYTVKDNEGEYWVEPIFIINHSKNIIDLIEVGDYVNGKLIHHTDIRKNSAYIYYGNGKTFVDYQIKSIVTKEQFASMEYRLED